MNLYIIYYNLSYMYIICSLIIDIYNIILTSEYNNFNDWNLRIKFSINNAIRWDRYIRWPGNLPISCQICPIITLDYYHILIDI